MGEKKEAEKRGDLEVGSGRKMNGEGNDVWGEVYPSVSAALLAALLVLLDNWFVR